HAGLDRHTWSDHGALWRQYLLRRSSIGFGKSHSDRLRHRRPRARASAEGAGEGVLGPYPDLPYALGSHSGPALLRTAFRARKRLARLRTARPRPVAARRARRADGVRLLPGRSEFVRGG